MIAAIYQGLLYGLIAGFSVLGLALTIAFFYGVIEIVTFALSYFNDGEHSNESRGPR